MSIKCPYCGGTGTIKEPTIYALIKRAMLDANLTNEDWSSVPPDVRNIIINIEIGKSVNITLRDLYDMASAFKCSVKDLIP